MYTYLVSGLGTQIEFNKIITQSTIKRLFIPQKEKLEKNLNQF